MPGSVFCLFEYIHVLEDLEVSQYSIGDWKMNLPVPIWENSFTYLIDKIKLYNSLVVFSLPSPPQL